MTDLPLPVPSALTQPYWDAAKRGELAFQRCLSCHTAFLYPRPFCPSCWKTELAWEIANGDGIVLSFSVVHQAPYPSYAARAPYVVAIVGLAEGPQLMVNVIGCEPDEVHVGMGVTVAFEARGGLSIPQFAPAETAA